VGFGRKSAAGVALAGLGITLGFHSCDEQIRVARPYADDLIRPVSVRPIGSGAFFDDLAGSIKGSVLESERVNVERLAVALPPAATPLLAHTVERPKLLSLFPTDDDSYHALYGRVPSAAASAEIRRFNASLASYDTSLLRSASSGEELASRIGSADGNPVVIIAHSEQNGRRIVLPSGSRLDLADLHASCVSRGKRCLVLTCHGDDFAVAGRITPADALGMWRAGEERLRVSSPTMDEFIMGIREARLRSPAGAGVLLSWTTLPVGSSAALATAEDDPAGTFFWRSF
jgi:hypothetical protein